MTLRPDARVFVAGHRGMVGSAIVRALQAAGIGEILTAGRDTLDLTEQAAVRDWFAGARPDYVVVAAARVGGIHANNTWPARFIYENLMIECNLIHEAWRAGVDGLLFLGSSCIYPRLAPQPMAEAALLTGTLEPTNEPYAIAKIAGIKLCESYKREHDCDFRSVMPTNLYGPGDNFDPETSHVIPGLIQRFYRARAENAPFVTVWGSGQVRREFLHVEDLAAACLHVMRLEREHYRAATQPMLSHINVGTGEDISIRELAEIVRELVGFSGELRFDTRKPDGTPRKLLNVDKIHALGWAPVRDLRSGLEDTCAWYRAHIGIA